jgi:hypothetical protein
MWLLTLYGFYSVVCAAEPGRRQSGDEHIDGPGLRTPSHRDTPGPVCGAGSIRETPDTDYRYRIIVPKACWKEVVSQMVEELSYGNFKGEATRSLGSGERDYYHALHDVWSRL